MNNNDIVDAVKEIVSDLSGTAYEDVGLKMRLNQDLYMSEMDVLDMRCELEEVFDIDIEDGDLEPEDDLAVQDVVSYIARQLI